MMYYKGYSRPLPLKLESRDITFTLVQRNVFNVNVNDYFIVNMWVGILVPLKIWLEKNGIVLINVSLTTVKSLTNILSVVMTDLVPARVKNAYIKSLETSKELLQIIC